tara:strand:- start:25 stop:792 length:768 start_codon:yes stop_codon:yes gene_type:complete
MVAKNKNCESFIIVLCLAGLGKRFLNKGYVTPKFLLTNKKKITILELIMKNLLLSGGSKFLLMLNNSHREYETEIRKISEKLDIEININFIANTQGQAETAYEAIKFLEKNNQDTLKNAPIAFHNGDTILINRNLNEINKYIQKNRYLGVVDTFESRSKNFSYVQVDEGGIVKKIIEKKVISNRATSGFYVFSNHEIYREFYSQLDFGKKEIFISDVYEKLIMSNLRVYNVHNTNPNETIILGTPSEYEKWLNND